MLKSNKIYVMLCYVMFINCLGYDFYIYGAFEFLCNSIANL